MRGPVGSTRRMSPFCSNSQTGERPLANWPREQVAGMGGDGVVGEIGGGGGGGEALRAGTDRDGDHVLFEAFVVADAGVAAGGEDVHETVFDDHFEGDVGVGLEEARDDRGEHEAGDGGGHVEAQLAGWPVAEGVDHIEAGLDVGEGGDEAFEEAAAGFGGGDAAGGAVEQADAEAGFEAAEGEAEAGGGGVLQPCRVPEAAALDDRHEGFEFGEGCAHCSLSCTACAD